MRRARMLALGAVLSSCAVLCGCASPTGTLPARPTPRPEPRPDASADAHPTLDAPPIDAPPIDAPRVDAPVEPLEEGVEWWRDAVLYFVMTDRFRNGDPTNDGGLPCTDPANHLLFHGGDFQGLIDGLPYLEELGVDALWITPVPQQVAAPYHDQCGFHGYWADLDDPDDGAIEPRLGGEAGLHALIDALHARGMRLVVDHVVNHPGRGARIVSRRPEWFHPDHPDCERLGSHDVFCPLSRLPDFAHERDDVADYLEASSRAFVRRFDFDAIRMDTVKHVPASFFAERWIPAVLEERPRLWLIGELLDEGSYDPHGPYLDAGFHGLFDFPLRRALIGSLAQGGSLDGPASRMEEVVERLGIERAVLRSTLLDNHDVPRFISEMPSAMPASEQLARYRASLAVLFALPGVPQLYYGDELGMIGTWPDNRRDMPAWAFSRATREGDREGYLPDPAGTFDLVRELIALRRAEPALATGSYHELWRPNGSPANVWAFFRSDTIGARASRVAVVVNGSRDPIRGLAMQLERHPRIPPADREAWRGATLRERLGHAPGATARVEDGRLIVDMPPLSVAVLTAD
jgi:alpha-amylase